jgi:hypothetical protein
MSNDGLQHKIEIEQQQRQERNTDNKDQVTALVTFERGGMVQAQFTFQLEEATEHSMNKVRSLRIEFI